MNRQVIAVIIGFLILAAAIYLAWRYLLPRFIDTDGKEDSVAAQEQVEEVLGADIDAATEQILGESVFIDRNVVVSIVGDNALWVAPVGGEKGTLVVEAEDTVFEEGDMVSIRGEVKRISEYADASAEWTFTTGDLELIRQNPIVIDAREISVLN